MQIRRHQLHLLWGLRSLITCAAISVRSAPSFVATEIHTTLFTVAMSIVSDHIQLLTFSMQKRLFLQWNLVSNCVYDLIAKDLSGPHEQRHIFHASITEVRFVAPFPSFIEAWHSDVLVIIRRHPVLTLGSFSKELLRSMISSLKILL